MIDQAVREIKKLDALLKSLSDLLGDSDLLLYFSHKPHDEMPPETYFEVIQPIFGIKAPAEVTNN